MQYKLKGMEEQIAKVIREAEELAGVPAGSYNLTSRRQEYSIMRQAATNFMMIELGIDYNKLSKYVDCRNRTTLYYWRKTHEENIQYWDEYKVLYKSLKNKLQCNDYASYDYMDSSKFELICKQNRITKTQRSKPAADQKIRFNVTLGNFSTNVYRTPDSAAKCFKMLFTAFSRYKNITIKMTKLKRNERIHKTT